MSTGKKEGRDGDIFNKSMLRRMTRRQTIKVGGIAAIGLIFTKPVIETVRPRPAFGNYGPADGHDEGGEGDDWEKEEGRKDLEGGEFEVQPSPDEARHAVSQARGEIGGESARGIRKKQPTREFDPGDVVVVLDSELDGLKGSIAKVEFADFDRRSGIWNYGVRLGNGIIYDIAETQIMAY